MKKLIVIGALLASAITQAHANLGSTYQQSCRQWGGKGRVVNDGIFWSVLDTTKNYTWHVEEQYKGKYCSMIAFSIQGPIPEGIIWQTLSSQITGHYSWVEMAASEDGSRNFYVRGTDIIATVWAADGHSYIRVTTGDWLQRHHLVRQPSTDSGLPPVQEYNL
jgi:hypothetical protein